MSPPMTVGLAARELGITPRRVRQLARLHPRVIASERPLRVRVDVKVRRKLGVETSRLQIEETAAFNTSKRAIEDAKATAEDYLRTIQRTNERRLDAFGLGSRAREISEARSDIDARYADERRQLERTRLLATNEEQRRAIDERLKIIDEFHKKALDETDRYYEELAEKEGSFRLGAQSAIADYIDSSRNLAEQSRNVFTNMFKDAEDSVVRFAMTGKGSFKDFANSVIQDLLRIQVRASLAGLLGSGSGSGGILSFLGALLGGGRAVGGTGAGMGTAPSSSGVLFADVGIKRVPRDNQVALLHKDEAVIPRHMNPFAGGGKGLSGGPTVNVSMTLNPAPGTSVAQFRAAMDQAKQEIIAEVADHLRRGRWEQIT